MLDTLISRQTDVLKEEGDDLYWGDKPKAPAEETPRPAAESAAPAAPAPENTVMPPEKADTETQEEQEDAWRPMGWLPRLRIFKNDLEDWTFTAKRRGTLIHHCLEGLQISGVGEASARRDAGLAAARGISTFPLPVPDRENVQKEVEDCLAWYARLPETPHWLAFGTPEHSLLDGEGRQFRVDLLVDDGKELIAVEYKTGTSGDLPADGHRQQLLHYLDLLEKAMGQKARGALVYLDRREIFPIFPGDSHD